MRRIWKAELKRIIKFETLVSIAGIMFCLSFDSWNDLVSAMRSGDSLWCVCYFMENSAVGGMCRNYILPVFAAMPFAASLCEERCCGATAYIIPREGIRNYGIVKYIINGLTGGCVVAAGTLFMMLILHSKLPVTSDDYATVVSSASDMFYRWSAVHEPMWYFVIEMILGFCRGTLWASISMLISLFFTDRFVITMFPFLGSYVYVRVCQMLGIPAKFRLDYLLIGRVVYQDSKETILIAVLATGIIVLLIGVQWVRKLKKGLKDGMLYESC